MSECRIIPVDNEPVRVQATGEWTEADHEAFAEIVRAARKMFIESIEVKP